MIPFNIMETNMQEYALFWTRVDIYNGVTLQAILAYKDNNPFLLARDRWSTVHEMLANLDAYRS